MGRIFGHAIYRRLPARKEIWEFMVTRNMNYLIFKIIPPFLIFLLIQPHLACRPDIEKERADEQTLMAMAFNLEIDDTLFAAALADSFQSYDDHEYIYELIEKSYDISRTSTFTGAGDTPEASHVFLRLTEICGIGIQRLGEINTDSSISRLIDLLDFYSGEYYGDMLSESIINAAEKALPFLEIKLEQRQRYISEYPDWRAQSDHHFHDPEIIRSFIGAIQDSIEIKPDDE